MSRLLRRTILLIAVSTVAVLCLLQEVYAIDATTAPTGLTAIAQSDKALNSGLGKIIFYWTDASTNEAGFVVHQAPPSGTTYTPVTGSPFASTTTATTGTQYSYTADSLTENTLYTYRVVAYVSDATGDTGAWVYVSTTTLDRTAPTTPGTPSTATPTADNTPTWTWTASTDANSGMKVSNTYLIYWDTVAGGTTNSAYSTTNSYTHTVALADGTWYVKVTGYDVQDNNATSGNGSALIDTSAPTAVSVSSISENPDSAYQYVSGANTVYYSTATASGSFIVTGVATDSGSGIQKINFPALGGFAATNGGDDAVSAYTWTYNWTNTSTQNASANITAYNNAGLTTTSAFNVYIDIIAPADPATPSTTPATTTTSYGTTLTPTLTWVTDSTDTGGSGVWKYQIKSDSNATWVDFTKSAALPGGYIVSKAATNVIYIRAIDNVNNISAGTVSINYYCDTSAPTAVSVTSIAENPDSAYQYVSGLNTVYYNTAAASGSFIVTGVATDSESAIQKINFPALGAFGVTNGGDDAISAYTWTYNWTNTSTQNASANITAYNYAGLTTTAAFNVYKDVTAPTDPVTLSTTPATTTTSYSNNTTPTLTWVTDSTDTGGSGVWKYQIKINAGSWTDFTKGSAVPAGIVSQAAANAIYVRAFDNVSNISAGTVTINYYCDTSAPTAVSVTSIAENPDSAYQYVSGANTVYYNTAAASGSFIVTGVATDSESSIQKINFPALGGFGATNGGDDAISAYTWTYNWINTSTQNASANITAYNYAGLTTTSAFNVYIDTIAPTPGTLGASTSSIYIYISGSNIYYSNQMPGTETLTLTVNGASDSGSGITYVEFPAILNVSSLQDTAAPYTRDYSITSLTNAAGGATCITKDNTNNSANTDTFQIYRVLTENPPTNVLFKTTSIGAAITPSTWQPDRDPYIYWTAPSSSTGIAEYQYKITNIDSGAELVAWTSTGTNTYVQIANNTLPSGKWRVWVKARNNVQVWSSDATNDIWMLGGPDVQIVYNGSTPSTGTWYQGTGEQFSFTSSNLGGGIGYYKYVINASSDNSNSATDPSSGTQWSSGTLQLNIPNSKYIYVHFKAYPASGTDPGASYIQHFGPYQYVSTSRLLKHKKFFDDNGALTNMQ